MKFPTYFSCLFISLFFILNANSGLNAQKSSGQRIFNKITQNELISMMKTEGYAVSPSDKGQNVVWKIDGRSCLLLIAEDNESIQFYVGITDSKANLSRVNEWNKNKKYSRSYIDNDGDPVLELDLDLAGGVTVDRFYDFVLTCRLSFDGWMGDVVR
jgi:hypothetical protein